MGSLSKKLILLILLFALCNSAKFSKVDKIRKAKTLNFNARALSNSERKNLKNKMKFFESLIYRRFDKPENPFLQNLYIIVNTFARRPVDKIELNHFFPGDIEFDVKSLLSSDSKINGFIDMVYLTKHLQGYRPTENDKKIFMRLRVLFQKEKKDLMKSPTMYYTIAKTIDMVLESEYKRLINRNLTKQIFEQIGDYDLMNKVYFLTHIIIYDEQYGLPSLDKPIECVFDNTIFHTAKKLLNIWWKEIKDCLIDRKKLDMQSFIIFDYTAEISLVLSLIAERGIPVFKSQSKVSKKHYIQFLKEARTAMSEINSLIEDYIILQPSEFFQNQRRAHMIAVFLSLFRRMKTN